MSDLPEITPDVTPIDTPTEPVAVTPVNLTDDTPLTYNLNGQSVTKPWKEINTGSMLHSDYTRKTQELAAQRREFESQRQSIESERANLTQQAAQLQSIVRDPAKLAMLHMAISQQQGQQPQPGQPPQALTVNDLAALRENLLQGASQLFDQRTQELNRQREEASLAHTLGETAKGFIGDHPILSAIPGVENLIFNKVQAMLVKGDTVETANHYMQVVADELKQAVGGASSNASKVAALAKGKLSDAIEPSGGQAMPPQVRKYKGTDDPNLQPDMLAFMKQRLGPGW